MKSHSAPCSPMVSGGRSQALSVTAGVRRTESQGHGSQGSGVHKKVSKKWTEDEQVRLLGAIEGCGGIAYVNWAEVAKAVPGRTGKQCREKYKNDLRPDITKTPWTTREEYILARAHAVVGNQWAEIAKLLPGRSENSIKNSWNATLRSKAEAKSRTFLWVYGKTVLEQRGITSLDTFDKAVQIYIKTPGAQPLETMSVDDGYFVKIDAKAAHAASPVKVKIGPSSKPPMHRGAAAKGRNARRRNSGWETSESDEDMVSECDDDEEPMEDDSQDDEVQQYQARGTGRNNSGSSCRTISLDLGIGHPMGKPPKPLPPSTASNAYNNGQMPGCGGDACVTIHLGARPKAQYSRPPIHPSAMAARNLPPLPNAMGMMGQADPIALADPAAMAALAYQYPMVGMEWQQGFPNPTIDFDWCEEDLAMLKELSDMDMMLAQHAAKQQSKQQGQLFSSSCAANPLSSPHAQVQSGKCAVSCDAACVGPMNPLPDAAYAGLGMGSVPYPAAMLPATPNGLSAMPNGAFGADDMHMFGDLAGLTSWLAGTGLPTPGGSKLGHMMDLGGTPTAAAMAAMAAAGVPAANNAPCDRTCTASGNAEQDMYRKSSMHSDIASHQGVAIKVEAGISPQGASPQGSKQLGPSGAMQLPMSSFYPPSALMAGEGLHAMMAPPGRPHLADPIMGMATVDNGAAVDYDEDVAFQVTSFMAAGNEPGCPVADYCFSPLGMAMVGQALNGDPTATPAPSSSGGKSRVSVMAGSCAEQQREGFETTPLQYGRPKAYSMAAGAFPRPPGLSAQAQHGLPAPSRQAEPRPGSSDQAPISAIAQAGQPFSMPVPALAGHRSQPYMPSSSVLPASMSLPAGVMPAPFPVPCGASGFGIGSGLVSPAAGAQHMFSTSWAMPPPQL